MLIIERPPILFIHIRRTAGKSIASALKPDANLHHPLLPPPGISHEGVEQVVARAGETAFRQFRSFCVVRHPLDRFISQYLFMKSRTDKLPFMQEISDIKEFIAACVKGIPVRISRKPGKNPKAANSERALANMLQPQSRYVGLGGCKIAVTDVFRFEDLGRNWASICDSLTLPYRPLPWMHKSEPRDIRELDLACRYVADHYREDFELFGYELGSKQL